MISFLPLSKYALTPTMTHYCTAIGSNSMIPNIFERFENKDSLKPPQHRAKKIGIKSSLFLINAGVDITILFGIISLLPLVYVISKIGLGSISSKFAGKLQEYKYNVFLRFWIQTYLSFGIYSLIDIEAVRLI